MSNDIKSGPACESCGNDSFRLVSEVRRTEVVSVFVDEDGGLRWRHDGHEAETDEALVEDRLIECTRCSASPMLSKKDSLHKGTLGISRWHLRNLLAMNYGDPVDQVTAISGLVDADDEELEDQQVFLEDEIERRLPRR